MSSLSSQVGDLEKERNALRHRVNALLDGNVVLVRRDGFQRILHLDVRNNVGLRHVYQYADRAELEALPLSIEMLGPTKVVTYHNTRERDKCGRWVYEEA